MPITKFKEINGKECIGKIDYELLNKKSKNRFLRLNLIYLEEEYRGKGYGKVIMENIIKEAERLNCRYIIVNLTEKGEYYDFYSTHEERLRFFKKFGFNFDDGEGKLTLK